MKVGGFKLIEACKLHADGTREVLPYTTMDEAMAALKAEMEAIIPRPRESFSKGARKLYDLALDAGVKNPVPFYLDRCWYIGGDNVGNPEPIGFVHSEAAKCLERGETVYGSPIELL